MILTYLDSGVLMAAARFQPPLGVRAALLLDDPDRQFAGSVFLKLELLPKPIYFRRNLEIQFYEQFFANVARWAADYEAIIEAALQEASACGMSAIDALHVAAALSVGAEELITTERPEKPIHRARGIRVVSLHPDASP